MSSQLRSILNSFLEGVAIKLDLQEKNILEIGIAGDDKPSGSYKFFGKGNEWTTMDINEKWLPGVVGDITDAPFEDNTFDLIIMTQVLEHIWDFRRALSELFRISKDYVIVDVPFMYPFHQDDMRQTTWDNWDDYWRFTPSAFKKLLLEAGFKDVKILYNDALTFAVCQK